MLLLPADEMIELGFPRFTVEDFYENFMETVGKKNRGKKETLVQEHRIHFQTIAFQNQ
jgi:hypothetical protein